MVIITLTFNHKLYNCNHIIQGVSDLYNLCFYRYEGLIKENRMHGRGSYKWPNGDNYIGEYHNGLRNGYGEMIYHSKNEHYKGRWQDSLYHGQGQYWYVIQCAMIQFVFSEFCSSVIDKKKYFYPQGKLQILSARYQF